jgi:very-short-patch-repair endonuclease
LWLWGLLDRPARFELSIPSPCHSRPPNVIVHRSTDLADRYRFNRRSVLTTTPDRALLDGAAVLGRDELARAVEQAVIDRLVSVATLRTILDDLGRRGRRGAGALRSYLDRRALVDARPDSQLEPLMARLCRDHRVGRMRFQAEIILEGRRFRPDFQFPDAMVVVEVDGLDAHGSRDAFDHDLTRQNLFMRHGWLVLRYTSTHLRRPAAVAREVAEVVSQRLAERSGTPVTSREPQR